jgi:hypothetical protein
MTASKTISSVGAVELNSGTAVSGVPVYGIFVGRETGLDGCVSLLFVLLRRLTAYKFSVEGRVTPFPGAT